MLLERVCVCVWLCCELCCWLCFAWDGLLLFGLAVLELLFYGMRCFSDVWV